MTEVIGEMDDQVYGSGVVFEIKIPKYKSSLTINSGMTVCFEKEMPNWFWRTMQRLVFGFVWSKYD